MLPACSAKIRVPVAAGADLLTTEMALQRGFVEGNPLVPETPAGRAAFKVAGAGLILVISHELRERGHPKMAGFLEWTATILWGGAAAWNSYLMATGGSGGAGE